MVARSRIGSLGWPGASKRPGTRRSWGALGLADYDSINAAFFAPLDWQTARAGCGAGVACYAGDDDPYVPLRFSREIAERLGAPLRVITGGKHLNAESGMTKFPELAADLNAPVATFHQLSSWRQTPASPG